MSDMRYSKYTLPNGREIYLTQRPDSASKWSVDKFIQEKKPIVRFQFTDDPVERPVSDPPVHWYPWVPSENIPLDCVFPFMCLMDEYVNSDKEGSIWLHCDSSSMRAPTYFGIYLFSTNNAKSALKISKAMEVSDNSEYKYAAYSMPHRYLKFSLQRDPDVRAFVNAWKKDGAPGGHQVFMDKEKKCP